MNEAISRRAAAALATVPDSMDAQARREASMGFGRRYGQITLGNGKLIMPTDGALWETAQMINYNEVAVRDSILRERIAITRKRADAGRAGNSTPP